MTKRERREITAKANSAMMGVKALGDIIVAIAPARFTEPLIYHALRAVSDDIAGPLDALRDMAREERDNG